MTKEEFKKVKRGDMLITGKEYIIVDDIFGYNVIYFKDGYYHECLFDECEMIDNTGQSSCNN